MSHDETRQFDDWWHEDGEWVEEPNKRRNGESGVVRLFWGRKLLYCKRQIGHLYYSWRYPLGRPTALREADGISALNSIGVAVPKVVFHGTRKVGARWQSLLVTEALPGMQSLDHWYADAAEAVPPTLRGQLLDQLGTTLARMHLARWQHGCLYAKHIFVRVEDDPCPKVSVALIDLEKSRRRYLAKQAAEHDMRQFERHRGRMPTGDWERLSRAHARALALEPAQRPAVFFR